jgi:hypothetical protein
MNFCTFHLEFQKGVEEKLCAITIRTFFVPRVKQTREKPKTNTPYKIHSFGGLLYINPLNLPFSLVSPYSNPFDRVPTVYR